MLTLTIPKLSDVEVVISTRTNIWSNLNYEREVSEQKRRKKLKGKEEMGLSSYFVLTVG